jgi:hypothetical protein
VHCSIFAPNVVGFGELPKIPLFSSPKFDKISLLLSGESK